MKMSLSHLEYENVELKRSVAKLQRDRDGKGEKRRRWKERR